MHKNSHNNATREKGLSHSHRQHAWNIVFSWSLDVWFLRHASQLLAHFAYHYA